MKEWKHRYVKVEIPAIGELYHLSWARSSGYVWRLKEILPNGKVKMVTPKTKKEIIANAADLLYTAKKGYRVSLINK